MDKPMNMSVKDYLIRVMSVRTNTPAKIIEAIVDHQFQGVVEAMDKPGIYSIEVSGFGKFTYLRKKAIKRYDRFIEEISKSLKALEEEPSETKRKAISQYLDKCKLWEAKSKDKINGCRTDLGGLEKQNPSTQGTEGEDRGDLPAQAGDM